MSLIGTDAIGTVVIVDLKMQMVAQLSNQIMEKIISMDWNSFVKNTSENEMKIIDVKTNCANFKTTYDELIVIKR